MTRYYRKGDAIEVQIEKIVPRGFGLGFAENLTVLVPLAAPGDLVRVRIRDIKKRTAFAEILNIIRPGPRRIEPPCRYFGVCGGCDMQQIDYAAQLDVKVGMIRDSLRRIGGIEIDDLPMIASPNQLEYRSRARWHFDRSRAVMGYLQRNSHDVIDVTECPKLTPGLQSTFQYVRESMDWRAEQRRGEIEAVTGEGGQVSIIAEGQTALPAELSYSVNGQKYAFSAATFFQANKFLVGDLIDTALGDAAGETAFDLYCGVGLFTLPLAHRFAKVIAVEENQISAELAQRNVDNIRAANVKVIAKSVERFLDDNKLKKIDLVLLDPPRSGPEAGTIEKIAKLKPAQISYVSCESSILARDLRSLLASGYMIDSITALDMFPQTHHVETVARLSRS